VYRPEKRDLVQQVAAAVRGQDVPRDVRPEDIHPSFAGMAADDEVPLIFTTGDEKPPGAGDFLGLLDATATLEDGTRIGPGTRVYLRTGYDPQAGLGEKTKVRFSDVSPALRAAKRARQDVPWARSAKMGEVPFRAMTPERGEGAVTVGLDPAAIHRRGFRMEVTSTASGIPGWFTIKAPEPPVTHHLRGGDVLDIHARLAEAHARPPEMLLDFYDTYVTSLLERAGETGGDWAKVNRWASTFWPAQTAGEWCGVIARQLRTGRTYEVTPPMTGAVHELYSGVLEQRIACIGHDDLPWPSGFIYLDKPAVFTDPHGNTIYDRAFSWDTVYLPYPEGKVPGVRIISWSHPQDRDSYWSEDTATTIAMTGGLGMGSVMLIPFGQRIDALDDGGRVQDSVALFMRCLWFTLESVIGTTRTLPRAEVGRATMRRAQRSLDHTKVNVVLLRRALTMAEYAGDGHRSTRWTCRWFVDEFWRHSRRDPSWEQANEQRDDRGRVVRHHAIPDHTRERCALCGARVVHVNTFGKGPAGLPYKQARQLYKLAR
jgi:hypothetical protein